MVVVEVSGTTKVSKAVDVRTRVVGGEECSSCSSSRINRSNHRVRETGNGSVELSVTTKVPKTVDVITRVVAGGRGQ